MRICSFIQTCSDTLLDDFLAECQQDINKDITMTKESGRIAFNHPTEDKGLANKLSASVGILFQTF